MSNELERDMLEYCEFAPGGAIAFVGALAGSGGTLNGAVISVTGITALLIALVKFTEYWKKEESEYMDENSRKYNEIFTFI